MYYRPMTDQLNRPDREALIAAAKAQPLLGASAMLARGRERIRAARDQQKRTKKP